MTENSQNAPADILRGGGGKIILRVLRDYVRPHLSKVLWAVFFMVVLAGATGGLALSLDPAMEQIFNEKDPDQIFMIPLVIMVIMLVQSGASYGQAMLMNLVGQRIVADIQGELFSNMLGSDQDRLNTTHSGSFISSFLYDSTLVRDSIANGVTGVGKNALSLLVLVGVMYYQDWQLAFIATVVFPFLAQVTRKLGKRMRRAAEKGMDETDQLTRLVSESLKGSRTIKAYGQEDVEVSRVSQSIERRLEHLMSGVKARVRAAPITEAFTAFAVAGVMAYAGYRGLQGNMTLGSFTSFLAAMMLAYQPAKALSQLHVVVNEGIAAARRVFSILDVEPKIIDRPDSKDIELKTGAIELENVRFSYTDDVTALNGLSLSVPAGQTVALVGPSGAGKSTVFNLIPRFYDVTGGRLLIDGQDVRDVTLKSLRDAIAIVTQEPFLFDDTIRANIAYGKPDASDAEIEQAARQAAAHEFIVEQPKGYDTKVGEQGALLSGGQRQRIAIARAMLADTPILLLDEATSALDSESEQKVQDALGKLMKGRTTVVIAHRLSTIMDADQIYVLENGRAIESGSHGELMTRAGLYARLYNTQFNEDDAPAVGVAGE